MITEQEGKITLAMILGAPGQFSPVMKMLNQKKKKTQGSLSLRAVDGQPPTAFATPR